MWRVGLPGRGRHRDRPVFPAPPPGPVRQLFPPSRGGRAVHAGLAVPPRTAVVGMTDPMAELCPNVSAILDRYVTDLMAEIPPPVPPKPFDLADLNRLAAQVEATRPEWDRMVCAPDVVERLRARTTPTPPWGRPPFPLGTPVFIDKEMPMGHWELRDGDRKVKGGCRCESCRSGEGAQ